MARTEQAPTREGQKTRSNTRWLILLVAAAVVAALFVAYTGISSRQKGPVGGQAAPPFQVNLYGGGSLSSDSLLGQVVVLHFWASWCPPCHQEAPALRHLWEIYDPQGVQFVGVAYKDVESKALAFLEEYGLDYPNGPDEKQRISGAYRVRAVPETYVIDAQGVLVRSYIGQVDEADFVRTINRLLGSP